jgi:hypothetical protein
MGAPKPPKALAKRRSADWEAIWPHYRAGIRALKDIGAEFDVSDAAIIKHARINGWARDLKGKIAAKAAAKVSAAMVSAEVSETRTLTEALTVEVESTVQARITIAHRTDIGRGRKLAMSLLAELEAQTDDTGALARLGVMLRAPDEAGADKLNDLYQKIISLPARTKTMKDLAETLRILIDKERQAFGMESAGDQAASAFESMLDLIAK